MQTNEQELAAAIKIFKHYVSMSEEERAGAINTGAFNSFIEAYFLLAISSMEFPSNVAEALAVLKNILETTPAEEALAAAKEIKNKL